MKALYIKVENLEKHSDPEVNKIQILCHDGIRVIVSKNIKVGDTGLLFLPGTQIEKWFLLENNLYKKNPDTGELMGGFFDKRGVVETIKLRGEYSNGFFFPYRNEASFIGALFDEIDGKKLCQKYVTPVQQKSIKANSGNNQREEKVYFSIMKHPDTPQYVHIANSIPSNSLLVITLKLHGTSGATGLMPFTYSAPKKWWQFWKKNELKTDYSYQSRTRNVEIINEGTDTYLEDGYYTGDTFRRKVHDLISPFLHKGETWYYEIVGYTENGRPLMGVYENNLVFNYGLAEGEFDVYVYRITYQTPDNMIIDLTTDQIKNRLIGTGIKIVPELKRFIYSDKQSLIQALYELDKIYGFNDPIGHHVCEGVVIRSENPMFGWFVGKYKFDEFSRLEGIALQSEKFQTEEDSA